MKNLLILLMSIGLLLSCTTNDDSYEINKNETTNISSSTQRAPSPSNMNVFCSEDFLNPYEADLNWVFGYYIPYPEGESFIEIEPLYFNGSFPVVQISVPYLSSGSYHIIHGGPGTGVVSQISNDIYIYAKMFNYRYVIYDLDSSAYVTTSWKFYDFVN